MKTLLLFNTLITPKFIKFFFYVGVVLCVIAGFGTFVGILGGCVNAAQMGGYSTTLATIVGLVVGGPVGLIVTIVGILMARISSELTLVIFMIRDELAWQRENAGVRLAA